MGYWEKRVRNERKGMSKSVHFIQLVNLRIAFKVKYKHAWHVANSHTPPDPVTHRSATPHLLLHTRDYLAITSWLV